MLKQQVVGPLPALRTKPVSHVSISARHHPHPAAAHPCRGQPTTHRPETAAPTPVRKVLDSSDHSTKHDRKQQVSHVPPSSALGLSRRD